MKLRLFLIASLVPLLFCATMGCSTIGKIDLGRLVTGGRDGWQHPERVVTAMRLEQGDRVAEIGAGGGYWLPWLSVAVGAQGRVYAVEVTDELVEELQQRVARDGLANVIVVRGQFEDPALPDGMIDVAMTSQTYHHIEGRPAYFARLQADLSERGRVVHIDDRHDVPPPIRWLQSSGHWTEPDSLHSEMREAGYRRVEDFDFLPMQSFQVFVPLERSS